MPARRCTEIQLALPVLVLLGASAAKAEVPAHGNLVDAVRAGDSASVKALLASDADPNKPNERGATPLCTTAAP